MTNLFYALLFILSGGLFNNANNYSNSKEPQFEQTQTNNNVNRTDNNDDDDENEKEDPNEN